MGRFESSVKLGWWRIRAECPRGLGAIVSRGRQIAGCIFICFVAATAVAAEVHSGESWVSQGLAISAKSVQAELIGGAFESDSSIAVSPDGKYIAFERFNADIGANTNSQSLWLMEESSPNTIRQIGTSIRSAHLQPGFQPRFSPSGHELAYIADQEIIVQSLQGGASVELKLEGIPKDSFGADFAPAGLEDIAWSPDGTQLGVLVSGRWNRQRIAGVELTTVDSSSTASDAAPTRLATYDLKNGNWTQVSPSPINADSFDWSPDGERIAFTGSVDELNNVPYLHNNLYITDLRRRDTGKVQLQPGLNQRPRWSPNGRWIAFQSQGGDLEYLGDSRVGLYDVEHGTISYPGFEELGRTSGLSAVILDWAPDSTALLLRVPYHLSKQLFKMSVPLGQLTRFTTDGDSSFYAAQFSGRSIVYLSESYFRAPSIYISSAVSFRPKRLTSASAESIQSEVDIQKLSWPSRDGHWTIHGWLLLPKTRSSSTRLPLLVYAEGGPAMAQPTFRVGTWHYPIQTLVANGIAVLVPNSRGRAGYGVGFQSAWETEHDCGQGPLEDDLDGVETLVKSGIVDPDRVALAGHSWGGYLAAYALTHTNRFRAIFVHEAVNLNVMDSLFAVAGNLPRIAFARQLGLNSPFADGGAEHLRRLSPTYQVSNATTPALLEFGADSLLKEGVALFQGLRYFNVPTELISYPRTGHVTVEPVLRQDAARRDLEWFAYWVLGKPTQRMLDRYGPPKISEWSPDWAGKAKTLH